MILKREIKETLYQDDCVIINSGHTYHYLSDEEYSKHKKEMEENGYELELSSDVPSNTSKYKIFAYYTKHVVENL